MKRPGLVLVVVLWIVALLSVVMYTALFASRTDYSLAATLEKDEKLKHIALSGIEYAIGELLASPNAYATLQDPWYSNVQYQEIPEGEGAFALVRPSLDGTATVQFGIQDEASKLNINLADSKRIQALGGPLTNIMGDSIMDWVDPDSNPRPNGAEDAFYAPFGYAAKNKALDTLEETLMIRDVTPSVLWGRDRNRNGIVDPSESNDPAATTDFGFYHYITVFSADANVTNSGAVRINVNLATQAELQQALGKSLAPEEINSIVSGRTQRPYSSVADLLNVLPKDKLKAVLDRVTATNQTSLPGLVNINTAPANVLTALGIPAKVVDQMIQKRAAAGTPLANIGWLLDVDENTFRQFAPMITTRSRQFRVDVCAKLFNPDDPAAPPDPMFKRYMAIVEAPHGGTTPRILYFQDISHLRIQPWQN